MSNESPLLSALAQNPGAIAEEIGATPVQMNQLRKEGKVIAVGKRQTGKRGRPPIEWALATPEAEAEERPFSLIKGAPKLPETDSVESVLTDEERRQTQYIRDTFAGLHGERELEDYRVLADRYRRIIVTASRRVVPS